MHIFRTALLTSLFAATTGAFAQTPPAQTPPPQTPPKTQAPAQPQVPAQPRSAPRAAQSSAATSSLAVQVTDKSGNGIPGVEVAISGPVERSGTTGSDGAIAFRSMRAGTYRLRFEHEKYLTLEREVMLRGASEVSVALNPAPEPVAPPPPPPQQTAPPEQRKLRPVEPRTLSIPDFLEKNFIRSSEPQKSSLIACTDGGAARILQIKEPLNNQQNDEADQLLYIVASPSTVRVRDQTYQVDNGWFALIPRGVTYSIARAGRNPVMAMMIAMGAPCNETGPQAR